jgi:hypothetical protein
MHVILSVIDVLLETGMKQLIMLTMSSKQTSQQQLNKLYQHQMHSYGNMLWMRRWHPWQKTRPGD